MHAILIYLCFIPNVVQKLDFGCAKAPGFDDRKWVHISNIDPFAIVESRELSRGSKSKFEAEWGIQKPQLVLFYLPYCPYSRKVLEYLDQIRKRVILKNVQNDSQAKLELKTKGGKMQVPCLLIDDHPMYDSDAIIEWLSEHQDLLEESSKPTDLPVMYTERDSKIGISAAPKPRDSMIVNCPHISNIGQLTIIESRELSRQPKSDF